jgi:ubiquinone/menaquinone biosynthesis C-methylase UbiE
MQSPYIKAPLKVVKGTNKDIHVFSTDVENIDPSVVHSFGEEWLKFNAFDDNTIDLIAEEYFDIITPEIVNKESYCIDIGCGTGRWSKYLSKLAGFIECVDPSDAIYAADKLLGKTENIRLTKASTESLPFPDETFDFAMSIGVLHHIPDTQKAMMDCVKKVKKGGYFYCYLYYDFDSRGKIYKTIFKSSDFFRKIVCRFPTGLKKVTCDFLAITLYMPWVLSSRLLIKLGQRKLANKLPLVSYANKPFFVIRNDALDKFGTSIEHRYSKAEMIQMMENCGLTEVRMSPNMPFYHGIGKKA